MSEKRKAVAICNAKRPCKGLALFVAKHGAYTAGIQAVYLTDTATWKTITPPMYVIKCRATDKGVVMNHCPFCGTSINERWTKQAPPAKGDGAK